MTADFLSNWGSLIISALSLLVAITGGGLITTRLELNQRKKKHNKGVLNNFLSESCTSGSEGIG